MSLAKKYSDARKAYRVSLRHKLLKGYASECAANTHLDKRWINGFMAAGFHSGLITLKELRLECLAAYRTVFGQRMSSSQDAHLERRLSKLCQSDA